MASSFRCCKNKPHNNWICSVCKNIFHKSCLERTRHYTIINDNIIWCSKDCSEKATLHEPDAIDDLRNIIKDLKDELDQKTEYITRLKRTSISYQNDMAEIESEYERKFEEQRKKIENQETVIKQLQQNNEKKSLVDNCSQTVSTKRIQTGSQTSIAYAAIGTQTPQSPELKNNSAQTNTIEPLAFSNAQTQTEVINEQLHAISTRHSFIAREQGIPETENSHSNFAVDHVNGSSSHTANKLYRKHQMLIVGVESQTKGLGMHFKTSCQSNFDINCQYTHNATVEDLLNRYFSLLQRLTKDDVAVFCTGTKDAILGRVIGEDSWLKLMNLSRNTNLIIIGPAYSLQRPVLDCFIYEFNMDIHKHVHADKNNSVFLSMDNFMGENEKNWYCIPSFRSKSDIARFICIEVIPTRLTTRHPVQDNHNSIPLHTSNFPNSTSTPNIP